MNLSNRRVFLADVGRGMLTVGLGAALAHDMGCAPTFAAEEAPSIKLGEYESLVGIMRNTPAEKLQPQLAQMLVKGDVTLKKLTAAGALANAVTFGGSDYVGYHTAMAMLPALEMSKSSLLAKDRAALPVLKVLYRNSQQIQSVGGASKTTLQAMHENEHAAEQADVNALGVQIRDACRKLDMAQGEKLLATVGRSTRDAFLALQPAIQDDLNVHRFVFAHRTHGLAQFLGSDYSYALLRQCVHFCVDEENAHVRHNHPESPIRALVPKLLDQYKLAGKTLGTRDPGDKAVDELSKVIYQGPRDKAAEAVAAALAEGIDPEVVGEAISLAANLYVLRQGSDKVRTHGDSAGVHASDATNAWRNMARVAKSPHAVSGLMVAAYHAGVQSAPFQTPPYPTDWHKALIKSDTPDKLLAETEDAIRHNDQGRATAAIAIYGERGFDVERVFGLMLKYAISEDGRLHGEKYYHTVREEYSTTRMAFRNRQLVALARVTASAYGYNREDKQGFRAAGYEEACKLLGVDA